MVQPTNSSSDGNILLIVNVFQVKQIHKTIYYFQIVNLHILLQIIPVKKNEGTLKLSLYLAKLYSTLLKIIKIQYWHCSFFTNDDKTRKKYVGRIFVVEWALPTKIEMLANVFVAHK